MGWDNSFTHGIFVHEEQGERKEESLDMVKPWRINSRESWTILECI
jgi:hypothetical protein